MEDGQHHRPRLLRPGLGCGTNVSSPLRRCAYVAEDSCLPIWRAPTFVQEHICHFLQGSCPGHPIHSRHGANAMEGRYSRRIFLARYDGAKIPPWYLPGRIRRKMPPTVSKIQKLKRRQSIYDTLSISVEQNFLVTHGAARTTQRGDNEATINYRALVVASRPCRCFA